jgi:DNA mismatch endonuclease (patch repair protein)
MASEIKQRNRSRDTKAELLLRRTLWRRGLRYRIDDRRLPGRPDVVFAAARVAVFCDGDFWHARNWAVRQTKLKRGANSAYWLAKIGANMTRDKRNRRKLRRAGWVVVRVWETDVLRDPEGIAGRIESLVRARIA